MTVCPQRVEVPSAPRPTVRPPMGRVRRARADLRRWTSMSGSGGMSGGFLAPTAPGDLADLTDLPELADDEATFVSPFGADLDAEFDAEFDADLDTDRDSAPAIGSNRTRAGSLVLTRGATSVATIVTVGDDALSVVTLTQTRTFTRRPLLRVFIGVVFAAVLAVEVHAVAPYVTRSFSSLRHLSPWWLVAAVGAELVSMGTFGHLRHRMFQASGGRASITKVVAMTYSANALSMSLPAGGAISSGYSFRRFRAWGATVPAASFALVSTGILSTVSFGLLGLVGALALGAEDQNPITVGVLLVAVAATAIVARQVAHHPQRVELAAESVLGAFNRITRRNPQTGVVSLRTFVTDLVGIHPRRRDWSVGLGLAVVNWATDLFCLVACARATGLHGAHFALLAAAYLAGMSVSSLSLIPGGLGVVEAAMIVTLAHGGAAIAAATAAVLLYRLVSLIFIVAVGWMVWLVGWRRGSRPAST